MLTVDNWTSLVPTPFWPAFSWFEKDMAAHNQKYGSLLWLRFFIILLIWVCLGNINLQIVKSISDRNIFASYFIDNLCYQFCPLTDIFFLRIVFVFNVLISRSSHSNFYKAQRLINEIRIITASFTSLSKENITFHTTLSLSFGAEIILLIIVLVIVRRYFRTT